MCGKYDAVWFLKNAASRQGDTPITTPAIRQGPASHCLICGEKLRRHDREGDVCRKCARDFPVKEVKP